MGFGPAARGGPRAGLFYVLRCRAGCGPDQCSAGRAAGQDMAKYAGRMGAQLFQPVYVRASNAVHACMHVFIHVNVQVLGVVHGCIHVCVRVRVRVCVHLTMYDNMC